jgi:hypothetical protein
LGGSTLEFVLQPVYNDIGGFTNSATRIQEKVTVQRRSGGVVGNERGVRLSARFQ